MKAILVINDMDIPKNCMSCPLTEYHREYSIVCRHYQTGIDTRPSWCPIKPLPQKKEETFAYWIAHCNDPESYICGWNDCIDAIGETE